MRLSLYILFILSISSCGNTPFYSSTQAIDSEGWTSDNPVEFVCNISDTLSTYDLHLIVDHSQEYAYENIYLRIQTLFPNNNSNKEQLTIDLASNTGKWVGNCSGDNCKCKVYLLEKFKFQDKGKYSFIIEQYTRDLELHGINNLTLEIVTSTLN